MDHLHCEVITRAFVVLPATELLELVAVTYLVMEAATRVC